MGVWYQHLWKLIEYLVWILDPTHKFPLCGGIGGKVGGSLDTDGEIFWGCILACGALKLNAFISPKVTTISMKAYVSTSC